MALIDFRLQAGMTQEELARKLDVDQAAVSNWERGVNPPLRKYRKKLCQIFHCREDEL